MKSVLGNIEKEREMINSVHLSVLITPKINVLNIVI